jgi:hypothetical protein
MNPRNAVRNRKVRWVGFDMDECIGSLMPLYEFVSELPNHIRSPSVHATVLSDMADALYVSEVRGHTWLIRPAMMDVLEPLYNALKERRIEGAFIYSNNSSFELVTFVAFLLNVFTQHRLGLSVVPFVFRMAMWNGAPCRKRHGLVKSYEAVQDCLYFAGLPLCSSPSDLLFYDDMSHVLQKETPYYLQVQPYFHHTPVSHVIDAISVIQPRMSSVKWTTIASSALQMQLHDFKRRDNKYVMTPQPAMDAARDISQYREALSLFLAAAPRNRAT